jgi:hypothetical protein
MPETKRCPNCGGLNPVAADWCGQCLQRFTPKPPAAPPMASAAAPDAPPAPAAGISITDPAGPMGGVPSEAAPTPPAVAQGTTRGAFTVRERGVVWTCSRCGTENDLHHPACSVCGTSFAEVVQPKPERPQRDPGMAAMLSLFLPGTGHAYQGLWGQAVARAVLSLWVVFVAVVSVLEGSGLGSRLVAIVFILAGFALWGLAAHDAYREARNEPGQVLLKGRGFLYVVVGLLLALLLLLTIGGIRGG